MIYNYYQYLLGFLQTLSELLVLLLLKMSCHGLHSLEWTLHTALLNWYESKRFTH